MNHLEEAKKQLELLAGQSTRTSGLMMKDVILFNALIAIAETQVERHNIECFKLARLEDIAEQLEKMNAGLELPRYVIETPEDK